MPPKRKAPKRLRTGYDNTIQQEMKRLLKIFLILASLVGLVAVWYWADNQDYFYGDYLEFIN